LRLGPNRAERAARRRHCTTGSARGALASAAAAVLALSALDAQRSTTQIPQFGTSVRVVEVYASVTDPNGEPIRGLRQDQFIVLEDGRPQAIGAFIEADFPLSVAIAVDRSWSMKGERLSLAKEGARTLLAELRAEDRSMIVAVSGEVEVASPLSADRSAQYAALDALDPWSTTALHDAIVASIDRVQTGRGRRALVLLSDGTDRYSEADAGAVLDRARRSDVMVYPVALGRERSALFPELAAVTGGRPFQARDRRAVVAAARGIARELRTQYLIGYTPTRPRSEGFGEWRSIRVEVQVPAARVRARDGYVNE
jgi:Ca-activated chloride channel family protein